MRVINACFELENQQVFHGMLERIEKVGRTCYKSEDKITDGSAADFVSMIIKRGHEAMLEHGGMISVRFIVDRGVSHELVRHRIASFAQESTRYCNYSKEKFGRDLTFIKPCFWKENSQEMLLWESNMRLSENTYIQLIEEGAKPQEARSVLPNSLKTEIVLSANPREWRAFFKLRVAEAAHPQMREVTRPLLDKFKEFVPVLFDDITY